ncbi:MAG: hypothetical protein NW200_08165 [Hyphomonadaceae bacterium]|nr:hypothetical protein [Hyphomonadaceae bacterium]
MTNQWTEHDTLTPAPSQVDDALRRARDDERRRLARKRTKGLLMGGLLIALIAGGGYAFVASEGGGEIDEAALSAPPAPVFEPRSAPDAPPPVPLPQTADPALEGSLPVLPEPADALPQTP